VIGKNTYKLENLKFVDLFAGIGGFRIALEKFSLKCVFSSEYNKYAQETYTANFNEIPHGDITQINSGRIPKHDILCAGFPCQAFSISGKRLGFNDTRGTLFFEIARIVKYHQPKVLFLENVKNLIQHDQGKTLKVIEKTLEELGYSVFHKVLNAGDFGVPTARQRVYILGFRNDLSVTDFDFPKPKLKNVSLKQFLDSNEKTIDYIINRTDIFFKTKELNSNMFGDYPQRPIQIGIINKGGQGERIYHPEGHAITFSANGGGVASKTGAYLINDKIRKLSPRECAGIMGFPKDFIIPVSDAQAYKQFGNSVAIPVVEAIFEKVLQTIAETV
jgi:DNA (cytosine-5)-methyltransferase 1